LDRAHLAINSVSSRQSSLEEALEAYESAGFRNVEFQMGLLKKWLADGRSVDDARQLLARRQLHCIGGFEAGIDCFSVGEKHEANHRLHLENARLIHELGGGTLVVGTDGPERPSLEALDIVGQTMRGLAERMTDLNVDLAVEFNWSPLVKSFKSAVVVSEAADHPRVGILFDPAHYYTTVSKPEHLNERTVPWIKHVHFDDMRDKPGEYSNCNSDRVLPGEGAIDLPDLIGRLERHGYRGYYSIEMFNEDLWKLPAAEAARLCYESMARLTAD